MDGIKNHKFEGGQTLIHFINTKLKAFLALKSTHLLEVSLINSVSLRGLRISEVNGGQCGGGQSRQREDLIG